MADRIALRVPPNLSLINQRAGSPVYAELIRSVADKPATAAVGTVLCVIAG